MPNIVNYGHTRPASVVMTAVPGLPRALRATAAWMREPGYDWQRTRGALYRDRYGSDCEPSQAVAMCVLGKLGLEMDNVAHCYDIAAWAFGGSHATWQTFDAAMCLRPWGRERHDEFERIARTFEQAADRIEAMLATALLELTPAREVDALIDSILSQEMVPA